MVHRMMLFFYARYQEALGAEIRIKPRNCSGNGLCKKVKLQEIAALYKVQDRLRPRKCCFKTDYTHGINKNDERTEGDGRIWQNV